MRAVWQALRSDLMRSIDTLRARRQFEAVKQNRLELQRFADVPSLLDYLHCEADDLDDKDRILAALVRSVHAGGAEAELSEAILWLALWPGIDALYHRLWRHFRDAHEDLVAEIAVRFTLVIHRADLTRIRRVAATLLRNVERDVRSILRRAREERARLVELPDHDDQHEGRHGDPGFAGGPGPSAFGISPGSDADQETRLLRERLFQEIGAHADLVVAVVIVGERPGELADRLGISSEAARKRCQRALDSLRQRHCK
jgi:DNA-directed RNA polymerase specialized sigma24 family protein